MRLKDVKKPTRTSPSSSPVSPITRKFPTSLSNQASQCSYANASTVKKRFCPDSDEDNENEQERKRKKTTKPAGSDAGLSTKSIPSGQYSRRFYDLVIWAIRSHKKWNWQRIWNFVNKHWPLNRVGCRRSYKNIFGYVNEWLAEVPNRQLELNRAWAEIEILVNAEALENVVRPTKAAAETKAKCKVATKSSMKTSREGKERAEQSPNAEKSKEYNEIDITEDVSLTDEREGVDSSVDSPVHFQTPHGVKRLPSFMVRNPVGDKGVSKVNPGYKSIMSEMGKYPECRNHGGKGPRKTSLADNQEKKFDDDDDEDNEYDIYDGFDDEIDRKHPLARKCPMKLRELHEKAEEQSDEEYENDIHPPEGGKTAQILLRHGLYPGHPSQYFEQQAEVSDTESEDNTCEFEPSKIMPSNQDSCAVNNTEPTSSEYGASEARDDLYKVWEIRKYMWHATEARYCIEDPPSEFQLIDQKLFRRFESANEKALDFYVKHSIESYQEHGLTEQAARAVIDEQLAECTKDGPFSGTIQAKNNLVTLIAVKPVRIW
jgi:hypothetical protein